MKWTWFDTICSVVGAVGAWIAHVLGGWSGAMTTLVVFMLIDYLTGIIVAAVFHKSGKTADGRLSSKAGWSGLCKKFIILLFVFLAYRIDVLLGAEFVRDAVIISFSTNELISILENLGLMGVPIPKPIENAIEVLKQKTEKSK